MPRFTANIAFMFAELPFLDRIEAAKRAGLDKVECHFPYEHSIAELKARLDGAGVRMTGLNTVPGDKSIGEWGRAGMIGAEDQFRRDFDQALTYATALGVVGIHTMAANVTPETRERALELYKRNIAWAGKQAAGTGVKLLLEPLNSRDVPPYLVKTSDEIVAILEEIDDPNVTLLFDAYHIQIMEGDLTKRFERHFDRIGHIQIAAVPSRAEPDEGEVDFRHFLKLVDDSSYAGLVGLEYKPRGETAEGLAACLRNLGY
ncbi:hydroxypyruvate isomerase family protein [Enterovirga rhinocerotis]|uniref:Hydroxypyruvate isomerase n=1 Tax=Enterovirga rhinocerotis TaxID=1339210 RepID=A0A4R7BY71_9HYPH|nr:TIM barrel protein [Enterovirga rhinocerotis]TDR89157.1 hydroxypyruvate isomerase [Enterovirga rhinocerotis]